LSDGKFVDMRGDAADDLAGAITSQEKLAARMLEIGIAAGVNFSSSSARNCGTKLGSPRCWYKQNRRIRRARPCWSPQ